MCTHGSPMQRPPINTPTLRHFQSVAHIGQTLVMDGFGMLCPAINPPSANNQYNQYNDNIFRFLVKRAFIEVPICLI